MCGRKGSTSRGMQNPHQPTFLVSEWTPALPKARGYFTEIGPWQAHSLLQIALNRTRVQGHHASSCWATHLTLGSATSSHWTVRHRCPLSQRGEIKFGPAFCTQGYSGFFRISYSQRCTFHPGTRSRNINPTAHNTFTVFKICRWSMCRRRFYEQEMLEQPIVMRGQHGSCQQRL